MARNGKIRLVYAFTARRIAALATPEALGLLVERLNAASDDAERALLLAGFIIVPMGFALRSWSRNRRLARSFATSYEQAPPSETAPDEV